MVAVAVYMLSRLYIGDLIFEVPIFMSMGMQAGVNLKCWCNHNNNGNNTMRNWIICVLWIAVTWIGSEWVYLNYYKFYYIILQINVGINLISGIH